MKAPHVKLRTRNIFNPDVKPSFLTMLVASGFYTGYVPAFSGTVGSAGAVLLYFIPGVERWYILLPLILVFFFLGVRASAVFEARYGHDPAEVTIDEVVGMWIGLLFLPKSILVAVAAFLVFRIFDIVKPFPISSIDKLPGGIGIMGDDALAGIYTNIVMQVLLQIPVCYTFLISI